MIYRYMFRGYYKTKDIKINKVSGYENASIAFFGDEAYLYFESEKTEPVAENLVSDGMKEFPNGRKWENLAEIFHYSKPLSKEHWERKIEKRPVFHINRLYPDKVSKYIYYHFQYQEEFPGDGDKYGIIFNIGNTIIMYLEAPTEEETEKIQGMLNTKNSPRHDDWDALMKTLFKPWEDGRLCWKNSDGIIQ